jgi:ribosomal protein S18 acetylase RimI-like enzyme
MKKRHPRLPVMIRPATVADIPKIVELNREGILDWANGFEPVIHDWMESVCNPAYFGEFVVNPEKSLLIAERGGEVCGTAYGYPHNERFYTGGLYVTARGQGVGTLLMEALAVEANKLGLKELSNAVYENNHEALSFFRRHGWVVEAIETYDGIHYCNNILTLP